MVSKGRIGKTDSLNAAWRRSLFAFLLVFAPFLAACSEIDRPKNEQLIVQTPPPARQEFRWSNGKMPKSFDPALASAAPEADVVRALFEGLTDVDAKTLREVPAAAEKWTASDDFRTWTFYLRGDGRWSNGKPVTARDFVRSWTRLAKMGPKLPNRNLLYNIEGLRELSTAKGSADVEIPDFPAVPGSPADEPFPKLTPVEKPTPETGALTKSAENQPPAEKSPTSGETGRSAAVSGARIGISAESDTVLKVRLVSPDPDFAKLVASPIFRPTYGDIPKSQNNLPDSNIVTNGPFLLSGVGGEGVTLIRSDKYWNRDAVKLERVLFVPKDAAEKALDAYRSGELDAVTNADFAPLALKLLTPYDDFRQTTHSALNFYEVNLKKPPFSDKRVRQALAVSIDREALTEGELENSTRPALSFLPFSRQPGAKLSEDRDVARRLLEDAGFPDGLNFPVIRLVVNRNDVQQRIARLVARMWKQNLNIDTEIVVLGAAELETARLNGDFDLIRRGAVFPSNDEAASMTSIFPPTEDVKAPDAGKLTAPVSVETQPDEETDTAVSENTETPENRNDSNIAAAIPTEEEAVSELRAIPLYFPTSYSLVKPYVTGFELNSLDAPSLKDVSIDNSWQPN